MTKKELENKIGFQLQFLTISGKSMEAMLNSLVRIAGEYADAQQAKEIKPLRPLTEMTVEEYAECFGGKFDQSYATSRISSMNSFYNFHSFISMKGNGDTYQKLVDMGFDVTFKLSRPDASKPE